MSGTFENPRVVIARVGEVFLKGRNRGDFKRRLVDNLRRALGDAPAGVKPPALERAQGRVYIRCEASDLERVRRATAETFGFASLSVARPAAERSIAAIADAAAATIAEGAEPVTFKVRTKRADKSFPHDSMEVSREVGALLLQRTGMRVDVHDPEALIGVEITADEALVFVGTERGGGGLPVGSEGSVMLLLSGGIDSPVAGHLMQRRGCRLEAVYFHSPPYTSDHALDKVIQLARRLARRQGSLDLHVVRFTDIQTDIRDNAPRNAAVVLYRRAMMRIASRIADAAGCQALATGENLGQVASQTLFNLRCINAAASMPVLRPLLSYDKQETIALARSIDTYETSILPHDDCCSLFVPKHPATRLPLGVAAAAEHKLDASLIGAAIDSAEVTSVGTRGKRTRAEAPAATAPGGDESAARPT